MAKKLTELKLRPLSGYCLIEPFDEEETTTSGLVMPEKAKEKPAKGKVIKVGSPIIHYEAIDLKMEVSQIKIGDVVVFNRWSGTTLKERNKEVLLVRFSDLQGVYDN